LVIAWEVVGLPRPLFDFFFCNTETSKGFFDFSLFHALEQSLSFSRRHFRSASPLGAFFFFARKARFNPRFFFLESFSVTCVPGSSMLEFFFPLFQTAARSRLRNLLIFPFPSTTTF